MFGDEMLTAERLCVVTCWEIATGLMPLRGQMAPPPPEECPLEVTQLIGDLMKRDPHMRPSAAEAYRHIPALLHTSLERLCMPRPCKHGSTAVPSQSS